MRYKDAYSVEIETINWLIGLYVISTFVGYLMPDPVYLYI